MKIVVAGGCGYIGSVFVPELLKAGHAVKVIDRMFFGRNLPPEIEVLDCDTRAVNETQFYRVDRVYDLAGLSNDPSCELDPRLTIDVNFRGAIHMARTARAAGAGEYVYVSSCAIFGDGIGSGEDRPLTEYARAKQAVENAIQRMWGAQCFTPRVATAYGMAPRMRFDLGPNLMALHAARTGTLEVWGSGEQWRPFVHIRDVARLLSWGHVPTRIGSRESTITINDLAHRVADVTGAQVSQRSDLPTDTRSYRPNFRDGLTEVRLEDGVREVFEAVRDGAVTDGPETRTVGRYKQLIGEGKL